MISGKTISSVLMAAVLVTGGCSSYHVCTKAEAGRSSIYVAPAVNKSYMPQVATVVTQSVRDRFLHDASMKLVGLKNADLELEITITNVEHEGRINGTPVLDVEEKNGVKTVTTTKDNGLDRAIDVIVTAHAVLVDNKTGKVISEHDFKASTQTLPSPYTLGTADDERMLMPVLARDLARQIHDSIAQGWDAKP